MTDAFFLPTEVTIYTVAQLHPQWLECMSGDDETLQVDGAAVTEMDAAGVQLLQSLSAALAQQQRSMQVVHPSAALRGACAALGLAGLLAHAPMVAA